MIDESSTLYRLWGHVVVIESGASVPIAVIPVPDEHSQELISSYFQARRLMIRGEVHSPRNERTAEGEAPSVIAKVVVPRYSKPAVPPCPQPAVYTMDASLSSTCLTPALAIPS